MRSSLTSRFQQLAVALERRAKEIVLISAAELPVECRRQAATDLPVTKETLLAARKHLEQCLNQFEPRLGRDQGWRTLLLWPQSLAMVAAPLETSLPLDELEKRWRSAPSAWNAPELMEASLAMQAYIQLLRGYLAPESKDERAAAWEEIAQLVDSTSSATNVQRLAELIVARESRGEASMLTSSIRHYFSQPNVVVTVQAGWLEKLLSGSVEERFPVNDIFGGSRSVGSGVMRAETTARFLPSDAVGQIELKLVGTSSARTTANSEGVVVRGNSTTRIDGAKRLLIGADGLSAHPAIVNADTSIFYENINAPGMRRRREESIRQANARRPRAEADASAMSRRSIAAQLDAEGNKLINDFNRKYRESLVQRQLGPGGHTVDIRIETEGRTVRFQGCLENALSFARTAPPVVEPAPELLMSLASSALEDQILPAFGGRRLSNGEISDAIAILLGESKPRSPASQEFSATFATRPCEVKFADSELGVRLSFTAFESPEAQYPALTAEAQYAVVAQEGALVFNRKGSVRVATGTKAEGRRGTGGGRQQTLRVAAQRKLNKVLPETISWKLPPQSGPNGKPLRLQIKVPKHTTGGLYLALIEVDILSEARWTPNPNVFSPEPTSAIKRSRTRIQDRKSCPHRGHK